MPAAGQRASIGLAQSVISTQRTMMSTMHSATPLVGRVVF